MEAVSEQEMMYENLRIGKLASQYLGKDTGKIIENAAKRRWNRDIHIYDFPGLYFNLAIVEITKRTRIYDIWRNSGTICWCSISFKDDSIYEFYKLIENIKALGNPSYLKKRIVNMEESIADSLSELEWCLASPDYEIRRYYKDGIRNRIYIFFEDCQNYVGLFEIFLDVLDKYRTYAKELKEKKEKLLVSHKEVRICA